VPWPGSFLEIPIGRLAVWRATATAPAAGRDAVAAGTLVVLGNAPALVTADGELLLDEVQPAGGTRMTGAAFLRGRGRTILGVSETGPPSRP